MERKAPRLSDTEDSPQTDAAPEAPKKSVADRMIKGSAAVLAARVFLMFFGFISAMVLARTFGSNSLTDGYLFALEGVMLQFLFAAEKLIGPAFMPVFMEQMDKDDEAAAWGAASAVLNIFAAILSVMILTLFVFPDGPVRFFAWATSKEFDPVKFAYVTFFVRWSSPTMIGLVLASVTYAVMNSYKRFFLAAFGESTAKLCIIMGVITAGVMGTSNGGELPSVSSLPVKVMCAGLFAAGFGRLATHLFGLRDKLGLYRLRAAWNSKPVRKYMLLAAPLLLGVFIGRARDIFNQYGVMINLGEGVLTANSYGRKLYTAFNGLVPFSVAIAMFPFFCEMIDRDDKGSVGKFLTKACRMLLLAFAPAAAGIAILSFPVYHLLLGSKVGADTVALASLANICYITVLPAQAIEAVIMQAFFSDRRTVAPTAIGITMSGASILWSWYAVAVMELDGGLAIMAVALGFTISRYLKIVWLIVSLRRTIDAFPLASTAGFIARLATVTAATGGAAWAVRTLYESRVDAFAAKGLVQSAKLVAPEILLASAAGFVVFLVGCKLLRLGELGEMLGWAKAKIRRRGKKPVYPQDGE